jgi:hypothetical protein
MRSSISEPVRYFVSPILIGLIGAVLSAFISFLTSRSENIKSNRDMQLARAIEICKEVIISMDQVHASLCYDVWYVAWRRRMSKCTAKGEVEDPELLAADKEHWKIFQSNLATFRSHELQFETELKGSFGEDGYEALLFTRITRLMNQAADTLREIYHYDNNTERVGSGASSGIDESNGENMMILIAERKQASRREFDVLLSDLRGLIKMLSTTMIHCIQKMDVGTLRGQAPADNVPDERREEAGAVTSATSTKNREEHL